MFSGCKGTITFCFHNILSKEFYALWNMTKCNQKQCFNLLLAFCRRKIKGLEMQKPNVR